MSRRRAATHGDAGTLELLADRGRMNAQLGTDLGRVRPWVYKSAARLTSTDATVTSLIRIGSAAYPVPSAMIGPARPPSCGVVRVFLLRPAHSARLSLGSSLLCAT